MVDKEEESGAPVGQGVRQESGITGRKRLGASGNGTANQGKPVNLVFPQRDIWIIFI